MPLASADTIPVWCSRRCPNRNCLAKYNLLDHLLSQKLIKLFPPLLSLKVKHVAPGRATHCNEELPAVKSLNLSHPGDLRSNNLWPGFQNTLRVQVLLEWRLRKNTAQNVAEPLGIGHKDS